MTFLAVVQVQCVRVRVCMRACVRVCVCPVLVCSGAATLYGIHLEYYGCGCGVKLGQSCYCTCNVKLGAEPSPPPPPRALLWP